MKLIVRMLIGQFGLIGNNLLIADNGFFILREDGSGFILQ